MRKFVSVAAVLLTVAGLTSCELPAEDTDKGTPKRKPAGASTLDKKPVRWGNWELVGDFKVETSAVYSGQKELLFNVKNVGKKPDRGIFTITFLRDGKRVGDVIDECSTSGGMSAIDVPPRQVTEVLCEDVYPPKSGGWDEIQIEDTY